MRKRVIATLMATLIFVSGFSALTLRADAAEIVSVKVSGTKVQFVLDRKTMTATVDGDASGVTLPEKIKINGYLYFKVVGKDGEFVSASNGEKKVETATDTKAKTDKTTNSTTGTTKTTTDKAKTDKTTKTKTSQEEPDYVVVGKKKLPAYKGDRSLLTGWTKKNSGFQEFSFLGGFNGHLNYFSMRPNADGSFTGSVPFETSISEAERDRVTFETVDVTPNAFKEMFKSMGIPDGIKLEKENVTGTRQKTVDGVKYGYTYYGVKLTIKAEQGTRAVKIVAKRGGKVIDIVYLISHSDYGKDASDADMRLYDAVRHKIESVLWKDGMSNLEKLEAMAAYLNKTLRYPGTEACSKGSKWWDDFSVDGKRLFYDLDCDDMSNYMMFYQGGIKTCYAAYNLMYVAEKDLGLPKVYVENGRATDMTDPSKVRYLTADEGVFIGAVKCSRNPEAKDHVTLWYKEAGAWTGQSLFRKVSEVGGPKIRGIDVAGNISSKKVGEIIKLK